MIRNRWSVAFILFVINVPVIILKSAVEYSIDWGILIMALFGWFSFVFFGIWLLGKGFDKFIPSSDRNSA